MENRLYTFFNSPSQLLKSITPFLFFVLCFIIRLIYLTSQDICIDEPFSIYHAQMSGDDIIRYLKPTNNPPLFELILHFWIKLFGISPFSVRFLPMLFGSMAVIYIYKTGADYFSYLVGVCSGMLYCFSTHAIYYAHDCRTYTLFMLLSVASVYYFLRLVNDGISKTNLILWCLVNVLLIYSHYFGFIVLFMEFLAVLFLFRKQLKPVLLGFCIAAIFYLPQTFILVNRFLFSSSTGTWVKEPVGLESIYNMFWIFSNMPVAAVFCLLLMAGALIKYFIGRKNKAVPDKNKIFIYMCFIVPFAAMFAISYKIPVYNGRYLFFILPFYYLSISIMAFSFFNNWKFKYSLILVLIVLFIGTVQLNPTKKRESKAVTEFIKEKKQSGDLVIICTHEFLTNFAYYYNMNYFKTTGETEYEALEKKLHGENIYPVRHMSEINGELIKNSKRVIYLDAGADFSNPGNRVMLTLESKFKLTDTKKFEEIFKVYTFGKPIN